MLPKFPGFFFSPPGVFPQYSADDTPHTHAPSPTISGRELRARCPRASPLILFSSISDAVWSFRDGVKKPGGERRGERAKAEYEGGTCETYEWKPGDDVRGRAGSISLRSSDQGGSRRREGRASSFPGAFSFRIAVATFSVLASRGFGGRCLFFLWQAVHLCGRLYGFLYGSEWIFLFRKCFEPGCVKVSFGWHLLDLFPAETTGPSNCLGPPLSDYVPWSSRWPRPRWMVSPTTGGRNFRVTVFWYFWKSWKCIRRLFCFFIHYPFPVHTD